MSPAPLEIGTLEIGTLETAVGEIAITRTAAGTGAAAGTGTGGAAPLVYLHSAAGEGVELVTPFLEAFGGTEVIAPMFPGFGGSEGLQDIDDIEDAVYHCLDVFDRVGCPAGRPPHVVGLSLGGWMAAEIASRHPERVRTLTLVNSAGLYVKGAPIAEIFGRSMDEWANLMFADQDHPLAQSLLAMASMTRTELAALPFETMRPIFESQAATAKLAWNPYLHNPKLVRRLSWITAPTLVVAGSADRLIPPVHAEVFAAGIGGARLEILDGAGHMLPLERPQQLARLVMSHIGAH